MVEVFVASAGDHGYSGVMRLAPCRFNVPLTDNDGRPVDPLIIAELQQELLAKFEGYTIHSASLGRWRSQSGRVYEEEVVVYEVAVPDDKIEVLREIVIRFGWRLGQLAMYFDAPRPSVDIIELSESQASVGEKSDEPKKQRKTTRRRRKKNRPSS